MVTEMIQYVDDGIKLKAFEADALYAGISIDTDGFNSKSGPRTFEVKGIFKTTRCRCYKSKENA